MPTCEYCVFLTHETTAKYVQIKEVNMDQIECQVLGEVSMVAECAFMNLPLWLALSDLRYCNAAEEGLVLLRWLLQYCHYWHCSMYRSLSMTAVSPLWKCVVGVFHSTLLCSQWRLSITLFSDIFYCVFYSPCGNVVTDKTEVLLMFMKWKMELFNMFI